jgi:hypothetical protein
MSTRLTAASAAMIPNVNASDVASAVAEPPALPAT